jgi:membrane associated rhomboid family serine protease
MQQRRRDRSISPILLSLLFQLYSQLERSQYKPPVTIGLLAINFLVHLHPAPYFFNTYLGDISRICIHPRKIVDAFLYDKEILWSRLYLSSIVHADDIHLYYNMLSLCWKGINLESSMGSTQFAYLVLFSLLVSHSLMVALTYILYNFFEFSGYGSGYTTCAVGFSAVLFSLKYVLNSRSPHFESVMGIMVPSKYAAWLELVIISLITPNASFIGHLAGILAGVLYVNGPKELILFIPNKLTQLLTPPTSRTYGRGATNPSSQSTHSNNNNNNNYQYAYEDADNIYVVRDDPRPSRPSTTSYSSQSAQQRGSVFPDQQEIELEDERDLPFTTSEGTSPTSDHVRNLRLNRFNKSWRR